MQTSDALYKDCLPMIHSVVNRLCSRVPSLDYSELLSQASLIFCNAAAGYDPSKGTTFKTHLFNQLKRLSENVDRMYGPTLIRGERQLLFSLDFYHSSTEDSQEQESSVMPSSSAYGRNLAASEDFSGLEPYREVLSSDAREVYDSITSGELDPVPTATVTAGSKEFKDKCIMTPIRLWRKRFKSLGWTLDRVRVALLEVRRVVDQWRHGIEPRNAIIIRSTQEAKRIPLVSLV